MGPKTVILWDDPFFWWKNPYKKFSNDVIRIKKYLEVLNIAYDLWVRFFLVSNYEPLLNTLKKFYSFHKDITCIANLDVYSHYYFENWESAWDLNNFNKLKQIVFNKVGNINSYFSWMKKEEIYKFIKIKFNKEEYIKNLQKFDFCKYVVVWNLSYDYLLVTKQFNILKLELDILNQYNKIPIWISELWEKTSYIWKNFSVRNIFINCDYSNLKSKKNNFIGYKTIILKNGKIDKIKTLNIWKKLNTILLWISNKEEAIKTLSLIK